MSDAILPPDDCQSMTQVRAGVDAVDAALVDMLARRFGYMRAAARIKPNRNQVRDEARKAEVIANARARAAAGQAPEQVIARLWEDLVEASIAYELAEWERVHGD